MTAQRTHLEVIVEQVPVAGASVVDVGCGAGVLTRGLRAAGADAWGVECSPSLLERARAADPDHADRYADGVGQALPLADAAFDAVVYSYSLHHVPEPAMGAALEEARRVLRPGGLLYVVEPEAAGPSFEVVRLIDDETEVRAAAQRALAGAGDHGFERRASFAYTSELVHPDLQSMIDRVVGGDASRADALERHRDEFARLFRAHGRPVADGLAFSQRNLVAILARRG